MKKNKPIDPLDKEVDELLKMAKSKKFEPGIYNFCDRWCEKCPDTAKCFLYAQEEKRKSNGEEDKDWVKGMKHSFAITGRLLEREFKKQGLDPKKVLEEAKNIKSWDDDAHGRYEKVKCLREVRKYMKETWKFLENFHRHRQKYLGELGAEVGYSDIKDEIDAISWYHTFLPTKVWRVLYEKESVKREKDKELKELMARDLEKFYALVLKCFAKSQAAWEGLAKKRIDLYPAAEKFREWLGKIGEEFRREYGK